MKRRTKILLLLVSALVLALVLGFICLLPRGGYRRAVAAYKKQLLAQGEKLTMLELAPPPSTNGSNGAKALTNAMEGYRLPSDYPPMMKIIGPGIAMIGHSNPKPVEMAGYGSNLVKAAELRAILQSPVLDFNLDYSKGSELPLIHLFKLKTADTLLAVTATQALHEKNYSEVWSDLLAAVDLPRLFSNEPMMISDLVRVAMARIAVTATWEALHTDHPWSDSQLSELEAKWQGMDLFVQAEPVMAMERAWGINALARARSTNDGQSLLLGASLLNPPVASQNGWIGGLRDKMKELYDRYPRFWLWKSSWSYDEELYYIQITTTTEAAARRILATGGFAPIYNALLAEETNLTQLNPKAQKNFLLIVPGYEDVYLTYLRKPGETETVRRMTVTAIALERFHLQHGAYPSILTELVPAFLPQVPIDFMDGQPLRYQLKPNGNFLLYSVGEDGKDDGGDATLTGSAKDWVRARDIVWPRAATPRELDEYLRRPQTGTNAPVR